MVGPCALQAPHLTLWQIPVLDKLTILPYDLTFHVLAKRIYLFNYTAKPSPGQAQVPVHAKPSHLTLRQIPVLAKPPI